jgi:glutamate-1-semialdehyde aminotransferase
MANGVKFNPQFPVIERSDSLYRQALELIPAQTQTLAKGPKQHVNGVMPKFAEKGKGSRIWDVDGNEFLDYQMGIGPLVLGYADETVDQAIIDQLRSGITFSLMHPLEVEVAEMVRKYIPNAENIRFSKTGADVTSAAIRLARAFTGKNKILCCGYHGWHDWYIGVTDRDSGIPDGVKNLSYTVEYNNIDQVAESIDADTAAIILEPMVFIEPKDDFLSKLRDLCTEKGILLIFDEMWTGFRLAMGGAQEKFKVTPDSKAVANGMPLSILTGRKEIMQLLDEKVFFFTTFGGEALSLAAAKATMKKLEQYQVPKYLEELGTKLKKGLQELVSKNDLKGFSVLGAPARTFLNMDSTLGNPLELKSFIQQELGRKGILWGGSHNLSFAHTEKEIDYTLQAYEEVFTLLKKQLATGNLRAGIKGELVAPVFRRVTQFNTKPKG